MPRGGARAGAGRKRKPNKSNAVRLERARKTGVLPCEILLKTMREFDKEAEKFKPGVDGADEKKWREYREKAAVAAKDAAPYYHSRLSTQTNVNVGDPDKPMVHTLTVKYVAAKDGRRNS